MRPQAPERDSADCYRNPDARHTSEGRIEPGLTIGLAAGAAFVVAAGGSVALRILLPQFRSAEIKRGAHQIAAPLGISGKLPLVGGIAAAIAGVVAAATLAAGPAASGAWWVMAGTAGFFVLGLADDVRKTRTGRGVPEGAYLAAALVLSVGATALLIGPGAHASGSASPYALAHWLGSGAHVPLSVWYLALILGTTLAASFSDGMDGLTPGTVAIATIGAALVAGIASGMSAAGWPLSVAAIAAGLLVWNLPSRWSPANRAANRRASVYIGDSGALVLGASSAAAAIVAGVDLLWPVIAAPLLIEGLSSLLQAKVLVPSVPTVAQSAAAGRFAGSAPAIPPAAAGIAAALPLGDRRPKSAKDRAGLLDRHRRRRRALCSRIRADTDGVGGAGNCPRRSRGRGVLGRRHVDPTGIRFGRRRLLAAVSRPAHPVARMAARAASARRGRRGCRKGSRGQRPSQPAHECPPARLDRKRDARGD